MAKVSKIKLKIKNHYGEDYEVHYNAKGLPMFSVKGLPDDFKIITGVHPFGFNTEAELERAIVSAVEEYKRLKQVQRKVIVYSASASAELTMKKVEGTDNHYFGTLSGISKKLDRTPPQSERACFGISYSVMMEIDQINKKEYYPIKSDGSLGYGKLLDSKQQVMDWSEERERFFENIYTSMRAMVLKMSNFIDQDPEEIAQLISGNQKLLG